MERAAKRARTSGLKLRLNASTTSVPALLHTLGNDNDDDGGGSGADFHRVKVDVNGDGSDADACSQEQRW